MNGWLSWTWKRERNYESAKQHLMFAVQNGGTTYMAEEAETKLHQLEQEQE